MTVVENVQTYTCYRLSIVEGEEEVGRVYLNIIHNDVHTQPYGLLEDVYIQEEHRRKGNWMRLWRRILTIAQKEQCYKLVATSRLTRKNIHTMYEKLGFSKYGLEFRMNL